MAWEDEEKLPEEEEDLGATTKGKLLPLECADCGEYFVGYTDQSRCPSCCEGDSLLEQLLAKTDPHAEADEEEYHAYRRIEFQSRDGWLKTIVDLNINLPAPTWQDEMHAILDKRGMYRLEDGVKKYMYPTDLGTYTMFLTVMASAQMIPFYQMCVIVRYWKPEYKFVKLLIYEDGQYKFIQHAGPWSKWIKIGKEEELIEFKPFNPINFMYLQPKNKGFRELVDVWRNTREGGIDALIRHATEVAFD